MCWQCDHPTATRADYLHLVRDRIDERGYFIQGVQKDRWRPAFSYTVGLTPHGHPELLISGMGHCHASSLLNHVAHQLLFHDAAPYRAGDLHRWDGWPLVEVVDVAEPTIHLVFAEELYGDHVRAVQLVYADDRGRSPWDPPWKNPRTVTTERSFGPVTTQATTVRLAKVVVRMPGRTSSRGLPARGKRRMPSTCRSRAVMKSWATLGDAVDAIQSSISSSCRCASGVRSIRPVIDGRPTWRRVDHGRRRGVRRGTGQP